jgi:nucleoside-diphosphate-sugar epimerase
MGQSLLITGASGFIGSHVADALGRAGHRVRAMVRPTSRLDLLRQAPVEIVVGDVTEASSLAQAMRGVHVVVHVAALAADWGPYEAFWRANVLGTRNVLRAASQTGVRRLVHISSTAVHGFGGFRHADESAPQPRTIWPYCQTKQVAEREVFEFSRREGLEVCVLRPGNVFGPRDHTFFEKYADVLMRGQGACVGGGRAWTCPTYVQNLVDAIVLACFEPRAAGEAYIITDGLGIDWRTFTDKCADALRVPRPRLSVPFWPAYAAATLMETAYRSLGIAQAPLLTRYRVCNGGRDYHFSIEKARRALGFEPRVGLDEALERTAEWYLGKR